MYRLFLRVSTMVWYNRGKAFAKMSPVLCGNGKVCKEYAKTAGVRDGKSGGGVRAPRPTHGFLSGAVGRPALWPPWRLRWREVPGRDESLPYNANRKKGFGASLRAGHARPLQGRLLSLPAFAGGVIGTTAVRGCFLLLRPLRGCTNKKSPIVRSRER